MADHLEETGPALPTDPRPFPLGTIVRMTIAAVLLAVVFRGVALQEVGDAIAHADGWLVLAAFAVNWAGILLSVARWRGLLRAQGGDASHRALARSFLVGQRGPAGVTSSDTSVSSAPATSPRSSAWSRPTAAKSRC